MIFKAVLIQPFIRKKIILLSALLVFFTIYLSDAAAQDELTDRVNEDELKTVMLYPYSGNLDYQRKVLNPAIISLEGNTPLVLEFDDLRASYQSFTVKIVHCGLDWKQSGLRDLEYLSDYNEFFINNYEVSQSTKVPYYHYTFRLPRTRISGNFIVQVMEGGLNGRMVIQKRFRVFESRVGISPSVAPAQDPVLWRTHQQVGLKLNFKDYPLRDPKSEFRIVVRQNYRDDKVVMLDAKNAMNAGAFELNYRFFSNENTFPGGSEFRFFDIRSTYSRGNYVQRVNNGKVDEIILSSQSDNSRRAYLETQDLDGRFMITNIDGNSPDISSDYVKVLFRLKHENLGQSKKVFINGQLSNWQLSDNYLMHYAEQAGEYQAMLFLKQGVYDYKYVLLDEIKEVADESFFEGNHSDTENAYEFFIYHQPPTARTERLIGYSIISDSRKRE